MHCHILRIITYIIGTAFVSVAGTITTRVSWAKCTANATRTNSISTVWCKPANSCPVPVPKDVRSSRRAPTLMAIYRDPIRRWWLTVCRNRRKRRPPTSRRKWRETEPSGRLLRLIGSPPTIPTPIPINSSSTIRRRPRHRHSGTARNRWSNQLLAALFPLPQCLLRHNSTINIFSSNFSSHSTLLNFRKYLSLSLSH